MDIDVLAGSLDFGNPRLTQDIKEQLLTALQQLNLDDHPDTLVAMCGILYRVIDFERSEVQLQQLEEIGQRIQRIQREEAPDAPKAVSDISGARLMNEQILEVCHRTLGDEHPATLQAMHDLALTLCVQGDFLGAQVKGKHPVSTAGEDGFAQAA